MSSKGKGTNDNSYYGRPGVQKGPSEYAKAQAAQRKAGSRAERRRIALKGNICGAKRKTADGSGSKICLMVAGWGTNHVGTGRCKLHGGRSPTHVKAAASKELRRLLGKPVEMNPLDALLMCIRIAAGEVQWLSDRMGELEEKDWIENTIAGKQLHLYAKERRARMSDLARYSAMAISLGIAERAVKLAETYGEMLARLIQGILGDLDLNEEQRAKAPAVVRQHLLAIDGGKNAEEGGPLKALGAGERKKAASG